MSDGTVFNDGAFRQQVIYEGLTLPPGISPTDFDAVLEFNDKLWLIFEVKREGTYMGVGQRLAYERTIQSINTCYGKFAMGFLAWHNVPDGEDVQLKDCIVHQWYNGTGDWVTTINQRDVDFTVRRALRIRLGINL